MRVWSEGWGVPCGDDHDSPVGGISFHLIMAASLWSDGGVDLVEPTAPVKPFQQATVSPIASASGIRTVLTQMDRIPRGRSLTLQ